MGVRPMQGGAGGVGKRSVNPEDVVTRNGKRLAACPSDAQGKAWRREATGDTALFFQFSNFEIANGGWRRAPVTRSGN